MPTKLLICMTPCFVKYNFLRIRSNRRNPIKLTYNYSLRYNENAIICYRFEAIFKKVGIPLAVIVFLVLMFMPPPAGLEP